MELLLQIIFELFLEFIVQIIGEVFLEVAFQKFSAAPWVRKALSATLALICFSETQDDPTAELTRRREFIQASPDQS